MHYICRVHDQMSPTAVCCNPSLLTFTFTLLLSTSTFDPRRDVTICIYITEICILEVVTHHPPIESRLSYHPVINTADETKELPPKTYKNHTKLTYIAILFNSPTEQVNLTQRISTTYLPSELGALCHFQSPDPTTPTPTSTRIPYLVPHHLNAAPHLLWRHIHVRMSVNSSMLSIRLIPRDQPLRRKVVDVSRYRIMMRIQIQLPHQSELKH